MLTVIKWNVCVCGGGGAFACCCFLKINLTYLLSWNHDPHINLFHFKAYIKGENFKNDTTLLINKLHVVKGDRESVTSYNSYNS